MATRAAPDPDAAVRSPWIDLGPALVLERERGDEHDRVDGRLWSGLALASVYAGFSAWAYLAWYRNRPQKEDPQSLGDIWECTIHPGTAGCDGYLGVDTYAGGADKLGHAWATMVLARAGTAVLDRGGWDRTRAAVASSALAQALFLAVEVKDYFYYELSPGDFLLNTAGGLAAIALDLSPRLDELVDFRVEFWPSRQYRHNLLNPDSPCVKRQVGQPSCSRWNIAEDYSGQTYLLALHLGAFRGLGESRWGAWSQFVDLSIGFQTRNYKPPPTLDPEVARTQRLFFGVSLNAQGLVDYLLDRGTARTIGRGLFEVLTPPATLPVPGLDATRGTGMPMMGGA